MKRRGKSISPTERYASFTGNTIPATLPSTLTVSDNASSHTFSASSSEALVSAEEQSKNVDLSSESIPSDDILHVDSTTTDDSKASWNNVLFRGQAESAAAQETTGSVDDGTAILETSTLGSTSDKAPVTQDEDTVDGAEVNEPLPAQEDIDASAAVKSTAEYKGSDEEESPQGLEAELALLQLKQEENTQNRELASQQGDNQARVNNDNGEHHEEAASRTENLSAEDDEGIRQPTAGALHTFQEGWFHIVYYAVIYQKEFFQDV
ncbi:unnamed protein product [Gongylonema pulchrum]|uniref:Uncharacterized protein n=1 Tax=Gongylonema pulchrum TaxID=637853 RepID=A0A183E297_9BILA|nr:unnamed protein product [Gongylonema pulchrum]